jgi:hypothetical protein
MDDSTVVQTSVRASWGALVDMVAACVDKHASDDERHATMRAVAMVFGGGYQVGRYKEAFFDLLTLVENGDTPAEIVAAFIGKYGDAPYTRL